MFISPILILCYLKKNLSCVNHNMWNAGFNVLGGHCTPSTKRVLGSKSDTNKKGYMKNYYITTT